MSFFPFEEGANSDGTPIHSFVSDDSSIDGVTFKDILRSNIGKPERRTDVSFFPPCDFLRNLFFLSQWKGENQPCEDSSLLVIIPSD